MGSRLQASIECINQMTLEEIAGISNPRTQEAVLNRLTVDRKAELAKKAEDLVYFFQNQICQTGYAACPGTNFKTTDPYTNLKKYSHLYTVLAGWMTKEDMASREALAGAAC